MGGAAAAAGEAAGAAGATALTVDKAVLNIFWELASVQASKREAAAKQLVIALSQAQLDFEAGRSDDGDAAPSAAAPRVSYSLRRLTRGLGSGREGARQGFALAFAGALSVLPSVSTKTAMDILQNYSEPVTGSAKGAEAREIYLGKLFGYGAIARTVCDASEAPEVAVLAQLSQEIALLSRKKGYLREAGAAVLLQLLAGTTARTLGAVLQEAPALAEWLFSPLASADAEALLLAVELADRLPSSLLTRCALLPATGLRGLFDKVHLAALLPALLSSTSAHPRVHSVWTSLVKLLSSGSAFATPAAGHAAVETFWDLACESSLFASSHERKFLGFKLFTMLLPSLHADDVPVLFSQQFMRCMVNSLTNKDTMLHTSASVCLSNLLAYVQSEAGAGLQTSVIAALQRFAGGRFDKLTHTGAISSLMDSLAPDSAEDYVGALFTSFLTGLPVGQEAEEAGVRAPFANPDDAAEAQRCLTGRRVWAIEQLCGLCRSPRTPAAVHFRVTRFLLLHAFFDFAPGANVAAAKLEELKLGGPSPALAAEVRELCATRLAGLLAESLAAAQATLRPTSAQPAASANKAAAAEAAAAEAAARKQRAVECASNLDALGEFCATAERAHTLVTLAQPLNDEAAAVRKALRSLLPSLDRLAAADTAGARTESGARADSARVLLRVLLILQLSAPQDYTPDMADLPRCLQAAFEGLAGSAPVAAVGDDGEEPPHHMDVLVEVLLSLLAKPSAVLREVVERAFRAFATSITPEGVRSMLRVVTRSKGRRHSSAAALDSDADSDDESDDDSDDDEEDVEEDGDAEEEDEEEEDEEEEAQPAVGRAQQKPREGATSDSEDSDDGAGMEDEAMFKADGALAAVLSLAKAEKSKKKAAAEALTHFKFRVLSLLEMFIKAQPTSPLLPGMVLPLLRALIAVVQGPTGSAILGDRIAGLLIKSVCKAQGAPAGRATDTAEQLQSWFTKCLRHAARSTVPKVAKTAVACCQFLLRVLASSGPEGAAAVEPLARSAVADYFTSKKCRLPYAFFTYMLDRFPAVIGGIVSDMMPHIIAAQQKDARTARDEFLTVEALKLTAEALRHKAGSAAATAAVPSLQPALVLQGAAAALSMRCSKPKRQTDVYKHAVRSADALRRFCAGQGLALPASDVASLRAALAAAKAADPAPPAKVVTQLDKLAAEFAAAPSAGAKRQLGAPPPAEAQRKKKKPAQ